MNVLNALKHLSERRRMLLIYAFALLCVFIGAFFVQDYVEAILVFAVGAVTIAFAARFKLEMIEAVQKKLEKIPTAAHVIIDRGMVDSPTTSVESGDIIAVRAGERIPLDGFIVEGMATVDESIVTSDSTPLLKKKDDLVYAGSLLINGRLDICVTSSYSNCVLVDVEQTYRRAIRSEFGFEPNFERVLKNAMLVLLLLAVLVAIIPPLVTATTTIDIGSFRIWGYRALCLFVLASPCSLLLATRMTLASALKGALDRGLSISSASALESVSMAHAFAFECNELLSAQSRRVKDVRLFTNTISVKELVVRAASLEANSMREVGRVIVDAAYEHGYVTHPSTEGFALYTVNDFVETIGQGVEGSVDGVMHYAGSLEYVKKRVGVEQAVLDAAQFAESSRFRSIFIADETSVLGVLFITEDLRDGAIELRNKFEEDDIFFVILSCESDLDVRRAAEKVKPNAQLSCCSDGMKITELDCLRNEYNAVVFVCDPSESDEVMRHADASIFLDCCEYSTYRQNAQIAVLSSNLASLPSVFRYVREMITNMKAFAVVALALKAALFILCVTSLCSNLLVMAIAEAVMTLSVFFVTRKAK